MINHGSSRSAQKNIPKDTIDAREAKRELSNADTLAVDHEIPNRDGVRVELAWTRRWPHVSLSPHSRAISHSIGRTEDESGAVRDFLQQPASATAR